MWKKTLNNSFTLTVTKDWQP